MITDICSCNAIVSALN